MSGSTVAFGLDIGGTHVKWALVDTATGELVTPRRDVDTPHPATRAALTEVVCGALASLGGRESGPVGVAFPAAVRHGVALTAHNIDEDWQGADVARTFGEAIGCPVSVLNDGDAAGLAEVRVGAGRGVEGTVVLVTLGTGVGTSLFVDGRLVPNIELGGLEVRGKPAGERIANSVRKRKKLSWREWARDIERYIAALDRVARPELVIFGGGVSKRSHQFLPLIRSRPRLAVARLRNDAGIVGAALRAAELQRPPV
ncbi:MAG: ROK family protein [Dehalococcoidia bacterium]|nr:ROK family protein [Dehalococcoidia bacterium]